MAEVQTCPVGNRIIPMLCSLKEVLEEEMFV